MYALQHTLTARVHSSHSCNTNHPLHSICATILGHTQTCVLPSCAAPPPLPTRLVGADSCAGTCGGCQGRLPPRQGRPAAAGPAAVPGAVGALVAGLASLCEWGVCPPTGLVSRMG
jgi:hypothetical protein